MRDKNLNLPNILTFIRLLLIPATIALILQDQMIWAFVVFLVACLTDLLDGYIARTFNKMTRLGTWLDPLADKLMAVSVIVAFTIRGILPWFVMAIVFIKELLLLIGGFIVLRKGGATPSNKYGKIAALILNISIASGFMYQYWSPWYLYATYVALVFVVVAFIQYAIVNGHLVFEKKEKGEDKE